MRRIFHLASLIFLVGGRGHWPVTVQALLDASSFPVSRAPPFIGNTRIRAKSLFGNDYLTTLTSNKQSTDTSLANRLEKSAFQKYQDVVDNHDNMRTSIWGCYMEFAQSEPFTNNIMIATTKTMAADFVAQTLVAQTPLGDFDLQRSLLFGLYGALYLGAFQYFYQVKVFNHLFHVQKFTNQSMGEKLQNKEGLQALALQVALDQTVVALIALPVFYSFQASIFSGSLDPSDWLSQGVLTWKDNFLQDQMRILRVWIPANILCFSVPLYWRLPARHSISFVWTTYFSFLRGGG